jgi:hypothetical protein
MNARSFASSFGRWIAPMLAVTAFAGTLGASTVASAQERGRAGIRVEGPRVAVGGQRVVVEGPRVAVGGPRVVVRRPGVVYGAPAVDPYYYGYDYAPGYGVGYAPYYGRGVVLGEHARGWGERGFGERGERGMGGRGVVRGGEAHGGAHAAGHGGRR